MQPNSRDRDPTVSAPLPKGGIHLSLEHFPSSEARDIEAYTGSVRILDDLSKKLARESDPKKCAKIAEGFTEIFDPHSIPSEHVRAAVASLLARYAPEIVLDKLARFQVSDPPIAMFLAERLAWHSSREVAQNIEAIGARLSLPTDSIVRVALVAARREARDTIEFVPLYPPMTPEALYGLLVMYIDADATLVPHYISGLKSKLGSDLTQQRERLLDLAARTVSSGGAGTFLFYFRDFCGDVDFATATDVRKIVDSALATESGKEFFLDQEFFGRLNAGLLRYITTNYVVDRANRLVTRR